MTTVLLLRKLTAWPATQPFSGAKSKCIIADSGRSIFLEQRFEQRGLERTFRWEVPYAYIIRIEELPSESATAKTPVFAFPAKESAFDAAREPAEARAKGAAAGSGGANAILPLSHRTKLA